ncbi:MAG TPA: phytanoyl-CoA dioxygenase family protein [Bryobacteraceae bacterium]|nr:phytanoyl-CoA dioxygenase family protein [Bryobacteraceae bacterium]
MSLVDSILRRFARPSIAELPVDFAHLSAFRAEYFPDSGPKPWLDCDNTSQRLEALPPEQAELCRHWAETGYVVLPKLIPGALLDAAWQAYEDAVQRGVIRLASEPAGEGDTLPGRFLNPHKRVRAFCRVARYPALMRCLERMLGHPAKLLQTIASHKGSQQSAHSDSIHMTTYPLGYLAAAWIAFEDINPDSGPLEFYPGSHRLPYVFSHHLQISVDDMKHEGYATYRARYEPLVQEMIAGHGLQPKFFAARKGDVLIWHANLLHGGSRRRDLSLTRKALVGHYFAKGAFVYHDLSAVASRQQYFSGCLVR